MNKHLLFSSLIFCSAVSFAQNISVNTTGAANSTLSMLEVLQISATANTKGLHISHSGAASTGYGLWVDVPNATNKYAIVVPSGGGNVGIGTTTPGSPLVVAGTTSHSTPMIDVQGNGDIRMAAQGVLFFDNNYSYAAGSYIGPYSVTSGTYDANTQKFSTSGTEKMRITSGGNVGIGTTNPQRKLDVSNAGQITFGNDVVTSSTNGIYWHSGSGYSLARTTGAWSAPNYQQLLMQFSTGITIDGGSAYGLSGTILQPSAGNVAIGQAVKGAYNLEVNGTFGFGDGTAGSYRSRTETRNDAGQIATQSGFFQTASPTNYPSGASSWWHLIDCRHSNNGNNYALQISGSFFDQNLYFRKTNNNSAQAWAQILTTSSSFSQGVTSYSYTSEDWLVSNNTGSFSNAAGVGWTPGTWQDVPNASVTRTITSGNNVIVHFTGRWEADGYNYYTPDMMWFRILRDGVTEVARTAVYVDDLGQSGWYFRDDNVVMTCDETSAGAGSHTWKVQFYICNVYAATERCLMGERYFTVTEIKP